MRSSPTIPPRIIQTARSRDLPPLARAAQQNLRLLHPDWEYLFFDDADVLRFIAAEFPQYRIVFDSFPHNIQRFDFFRYLAVLRHGGFYFDLDVFLAENLHELLSHRSVFPFEELSINRFLHEEHGLHFELGNYAFAAAPRHPFLELIVENCVRAQKDPAWTDPMFRGIPKPFRAGFDVLHTTGPGLVTRTYAAAGSAVADDVTVIHPSVPVGRKLQVDLTDASTWHQFGRFGVHAMAASWRPRQNFLLRKASLFWETRQRAHAAAAARAASIRFASPASAAASRLA